MAERFESVAAAGGIQEYRLKDNGLRVLLVPDRGVPVVAVCVVLHVGSRNEAVGHTGATHLLEHLMFKGSRRFNAENGNTVARLLERVGAAFNATTWLDRTNYYETLPPEHVELALEIEADRMRHALLRPEDLAAELTVVANEFSRGENDPFDVLLKESFATAFREHPYHHPTIGWRGDIEHASIERLRHFYDTFYYPDNASLILVGDFEAEEMLGRVARHFASLPAAPHPIPRVVTVEPPQQGERRFVIRRSGEVGWVAVSWRTPETAHPDTHALAVLADAVASGVTSRLYQRLVETGRCLDVQAVPWQLRDPGLFQVFATLNPPATHQEVEEVIREELAAVARHGLEEQELERAKVQVEAQTAFHRDSPAQVAAALTESISAVDWRFYLEYPQRVRAVTAEDVRRVAATYCHDDAVSVGYFVPRNGARRPEPVASAVGIPGPQPCHYRPVFADQAVVRRLPGGPQVLVFPRRHNETVYMHGSFLAGAGMAPMSSWTAASLLPDMLERGTAAMDRLELARTLEDRGIDLELGAESFNPLEVLISGRCLSRHLKLLLELTTQMLRAPSLPAAELDKLRALRLGELAQAQEDTFLRAFEALSRLLYPPGHPCYRRTMEDRRRGLAEVSREELAALHGQLYGPASLVLALVGDVDPEQVLALLEDLWRGWAGGAAAPPELPRLRPTDTSPGQVREAMEDKPNIDVLLGHPGGLRRRDDDFIPALLGNSVLGHSTLSSRLGRRLRDREGLTYGVISRFFGAVLLDGPWAATFSVAPENLERGLAAAREEIARYVAEGPTEEELADERLAFSGSYRVALATSAGIARELARLARAGLPPEELDRLPGAIEGTSLAAVREAVRAHLAPEHLAVAAAGQFVDPPGNPR